MSERSVLRMLARLVKPSRIRDLELIDLPDGSWSARVSFRDKPDRWFKGMKDSFKEEIWFPGEDAEKQCTR